jgi:hypothetical protein
MLLISKNPIFRPPEEKDTFAICNQRDDACGDLSLSLKRQAECFGAKLKVVKALNCLIEVENGDIRLETEVLIARLNEYEGSDRRALKILRRIFTGKKYRHDLRRDLHHMKVDLICWLPGAEHAQVPHHNWRHLNKYAERLVTRSKVVKGLGRLVHCENWGPRDASMSIIRLNEAEPHDRRALKILRRILTGKGYQIDLVSAGLSYVDLNCWLGNVNKGHNENSR